MSLIADRHGQPNQATQLASHLLVGAVAAVVAQQVHGPEAALIAFVVVALMHAYFDAPVAKALVTALA